MELSLGGLSANTVWVGAGYSEEEGTTMPEFVVLYRRAFAEFGTFALWSMRAFEEPTPEDAMVVARALRIEGDLPARRLAEEIEQACRAVV